jgi:hypothetical protein
MVTMSQGERGILEFTYKFPGQYMFHAHKTEFAEKGWMGLFFVKDSAEPNVVVALNNNKTANYLAELGNNNNNNNNNNNYSHTESAKTIASHSRDDGFVQYQSGVGS